MKMQMKLLLTVFSLFCLFSISAENLVRRPEPGKNPVWRLTTWIKKPGTFLVQDENLILRNADRTQTTMVEQSIRLKAHTNYKLSFRIMGDKIESDGSKGSGASLLILHRGKYVFECSPAGIWKSVTGSFGWKTCSFSFRTSDEIDKSCNLYLVLRKSSGSVSFSNICLEEEEKKLSRSPAAAKLIPVCWQKKVWNLAEGQPGVLLCELRLQPRKNVSYRIELDLPAGIELAAASPWHLVNSKTANDAVLSFPSKKGNGFRTWRATLNAQFASTLRRDSFVWCNHYRLFLLARGKSSGGRAAFRLYADAKELLPEQEFQINVLAPVRFPEQRLRRFGLHISYLNCLTAPLPVLRKAGLDYWRNLAEKPETFTVFRYGRLAPEIREEVQRDFRTALFVGAHHTTPLGNFAGWRKRTGKEIPTILDSKGKKIDWACPSYAEQPGTPFWTEYTAELLRKNLAELPTSDRIVWDIEPGAKEFCYCPVCRKKFSDSINAGRLLTTEEIRRNHSAEWFAFRVGQNARIINCFAALCREKFPGKEIVLCTDPLHFSPPHVQEWCGVDVRLSDANYDLFMNMPYYQGARWYDDLQFNQTSLKTPNYPLIDPTENMEMFYTRYTPEGVEMNMVAAAALGARGIGFWPGDNFDGRYLHAIANGVRAIADGEACYFGERCDASVTLTPENVVRMPVEDSGRKVIATVPDFTPHLRFTAHKTDSAFLVTVFNYHPSQELVAKIALPLLETSGTWHVLSLKDRKRYAKADPKAGFHAAVPANSVRQFKITRDSVKGYGEMDPALLEKKLATFRANNRSEALALNLRKGAAALCWGVLPGGSGPLLKLSFGNRAIYLDPSVNAAVTGCRIDDLEDILAGDSRGVLDEFHLYSLNENLSFRITEAKIADGNPTVRMTAVVPSSENADPNSRHPAGLEIEKILSLENGGTTIRSIYTLKNPKGNARAIKTGFRLKNYPRLGAAWNTGKALPSFWRIDIPGTRNPICFRGSNRPDNLVLARGTAEVPGGLKGEILSERYAGGTSTLSAAFGDRKAKLGFSLTPEAACAGFLIWWNSSAPGTFEPLTCETVLKPGEHRTFVSVIRIAP